MAYPRRRTYKRKRPYRRTFRKKVTRKVRAYKRTRRFYKNILYNKGAMLGKTKVVNLAYHDISHLAYGGVSGAPVYLNWRANSIYDPDYRLGGGQPMAHDQWGDLFDRYKVIGAKITCRFMWRSTPAQIHRCGITLDRDIAPAITFSQMLEQTHGKKTAFLKPDSLSMVTLTANFSPKKFFGDRYKDADTTADFGADPVAPAFFRPWIFPVDGAASGAEVTVDTMIEYIVLLSEPKELGRS